MSTNNPAFGYWEHHQDPTPGRSHYQYQGWSWPPKTVEGYSNPRGTVANAEAGHTRRGFKTDRITHEAANAFIRGSIYVAGAD